MSIRLTTFGETAMVNMIKRYEAMGYKKVRVEKDKVNDLFVVEFLRPGEEA